MINQAICKDKRVHELSSDTSRLAFTWLVAFADCEGRVYGDPAIVKSLVFPRRDDIDSITMESFIREWAEAGLVVWYESEDDQWLWFPAFEKNQTGLRKDREPESIIPPYVSGECALCADDCRKIAGLMPEDCRPKRKEEKITEEKITEVASLSEFYRAYESEIGVLSPAQLDDVKSIIGELESRGLESWWQDALAVAANANARNWNYVRKVLTNCLESGRPPRAGKPTAGKSREYEQKGPTLTT